MKKILVLNFFPAFTPPASGGELRYFYIYQKLSKYFDITLLSPTYNNSDIEIIEHSKQFKEYRIPKEDIHNKIHWELEQENFSPEFSALTCAYSGEYYNEYHNYYLRLYPEADIIIHESPFMLNYDLFLGVDNKPRIYNSYNVEYDLLKQIYHGDQGKKHLKYIFELEKKLIQNVEILFSISSLEIIKFNEYYKVNKDKVKLAPNGINPQNFLKRDKNINKKTAFFIGSGHPPNIEAVNFIINELADKCPEITFLIAGTCCSAINTEKTNIKLLGKVNEQEKNTLFQTSDISINPMFSGAGTNLKTLEYLSMGIPMVSTEVGVRGIEVEDGKHFIMASKKDFADKLNILVNDIPLKASLSKKSKYYINENFNWEKIAESISKEIININNKTVKTLLVLNDFEVSTPFGGGEIRINKLYSEISKTYNVLLLCLNNSQNRIKKTWITDSFLEISIPKTEEHREEENYINSQYWVSATDIVNSYMISKNKLFMNSTKAIASTFDITVLCHPYMYDSIKNVPYKYLIHESLNHELSLKKELLSEHPQSEMLIKKIENIEYASCTTSNFIISVSDTDHKDLQTYTEKKELDITTIKNGVEIVNDLLFEKEFTSIKEKFGDKTTVLFIGSAHMPNIESAKFIINSLAIKMKHCYFIIIGSVCDTVIKEDIPSNVLLFGRLDNDYKNVLCSITDIAINPMFSGSGSNLKLAEYFAWKLPTVTTPFGARGYNIQNEKEALICEINDFSKNIDTIIADKQLQKNLSYNAFNYVQDHVEWTTLGKQYRDLLDQKVFGIVRKKLLIVTYRFTIPPLGGAEVYMYELLQTLDDFGDFDITVAYLDAYNIENQYHFSINASHNTKTFHNKFKHVTFKKFSFDELENEKKLENAKLLMQLWLNEFLESAKKFIHHYTYPILLGGWNFPEKIDTSTQIWSSKRSEIYLLNTNTLTIKGFSPSKKIVTFKIEDNTIYEKKVNGSFSIILPIHSSGILSIECKEEFYGDDIRPLGILIESIVLDKNELNLGYLYRDFLKENYLNDYINELIQNTSYREDYFDDIFQKTRGLNSLELEKYLDQSIKKFDILLGHSVPFAITPIVSKYASKNKKPFTLLPHFHFDDEFYHWKSYYSAMKKANAVFASPTISIELFYDKLNINTVEIPGGGINKNEYQNIDSKSFLQLYPSEKPFFLILGRKAGAKNYQSIIDAIEKINTQEHLCNLVMIGRDEDGVQINSNYTYYLGEQSREVVLGALQESYALVTMSESESFGIVIVEAWMLQKPVIINEKCPAFIELVEDGINGLHTNKDNLENTLSHLLNNVNQACELGKNGNTLVDKYRWNIIGEKINNSLLMLLNTNHELIHIRDKTS